MAELFGGRTGYDTGRSAGTAWHHGPYGVPLLDDAPARMVARGHTHFLLEPLDIQALPPGAPLLTYRDVADVDAGRPA